MVCPNCGNALPSGSKPTNCPACGRQLYTGSQQPKQKTPFSKRRARVFGALMALLSGWKLAAMTGLCIDAIRGSASEIAGYAGYSATNMDRPTATQGIWSKVFFFMLVAETCMAILLFAWGLYQLLNRQKEVPASGTYLVVGFLDLALAVVTFCAVFKQTGGVENTLETGAHVLLIHALCLIGIGVCYCIMRRRREPAETKRVLLYHNSSLFPLSDVILLRVDATRTDTQDVLRNIYAMVGREVSADAEQDLPCLLVEAVTPADAEQLKVRLTEAGAEVEVRPHNDPSK